MYMKEQRETPPTYPSVFDMLNSEPTERPPLDPASIQIGPYVPNISSSSYFPAPLHRLQRQKLRTRATPKRRRRTRW